MKRPLILPQCSSMREFNGPIPHCLCHPRKSWKMRCESGSNSAYPNWVHLKILGSVTIWETGPKRNKTRLQKLYKVDRQRWGKGSKSGEKQFNRKATFRNG